MTMTMMMMAEDRVARSWAATSTTFPTNIAQGHQEKEKGSIKVATTGQSSRASRPNKPQRFAPDGWI
eukprot:4629513-Karenia_brevis.AAC.1